MPEQTKLKELTGRHVLFILLAFFGVMLSVNIYFTVMAVKSFSGEDVPRSYRQGLEYNQTIEARNRQDALGWTVTANAANDRVLVQIHDRQGNAVSGLDLDGKLRHPATLSNDQTLNFQEIEPGLYEAAIMGLAGKWSLVAVATQNDDSFRFEHELWLS